MAWDGQRGINLVFYADDIRIAGQYHDWVHDALAVTAAMFCKMRLEANLEKTKAMVCTRRLIWGEWRDTTYKQPETGKGATLREQKKTQVICTMCSVTVWNYYLKIHMDLTHSICVPQKREVNEVGGLTTTYMVSFSRLLQEVKCQVLGVFRGIA